MEIKSPIKAIRAYCLECGNNQAHEVKVCPCTDCALFAFRFGKNPYSTRTMTPEQRQAASDRMKAIRQSK